MEQSDFMNTDYSYLEDTDLNDEDLYNAVETILTRAAQSAAAEPIMGTSELQTSVSTTSSSAPGRFVPHTPFHEFLQQQQNSNTKRKTTNDLKLFQSYLTSQNDSRFPQFIPPTDLSEHISGFLLSVRKKNGDEFEPTTLRSFLSSINRHLITNGYKFSIMTDPQFRQCRDILAAKQKQLKSMGKGNKPMAADEISDNDLNVMYETKVLGPYSPSSLIYSMWMMCTLQFGMRTGKESHDLRWGDVELKTDDDGSEYLVYTQERQTKTRTGSNPRDIRKTKPRAYAVPEVPNRDPVALYKKFRSMRPIEMLDPDSPFFLSINYTPKAGHPWYKKIPMGINKLYSVMNDLKTGAGLQVNDRRLTPYSVRKHLIQKLTDEGLPPNQIVQISGHKNVNSLNNYSHLKAEQTKKISSILSNCPVPSVKTPEVTHTETSIACQSSVTRVPVTFKDSESAVMPSQVHSHVAPIPVQSPCCRSFNPSHLGGLISGNTIHGNININFNQSRQLSQNTAKFTASVTSPKMAMSMGEQISPVRKFKRIRVIESDSD